MESDTIMEEEDKKIKKETTIDELNSFFSNVSFDYYNIPMAMLICFYKNNFNPMKQNDIYKSIISNPDYKEKLRKTNGKKYTRISSAVQRTILYDLIFKKVEKDKNEIEDDNETKYSIVLNEIIDYWKEQASAMQKDVIVKVIEKNNLEEKKQLSRLRERKKKTVSNESVSVTKTKPQLLNRKKKRFGGTLKRKFRKKISTSNNQRTGMRTRNSSTKKREKFDSFDDSKKKKMYNLDSDDNEISLEEDDDEDYTNYRVTSNIQNKNKAKTNNKQKEKETKIESEESSEDDISDDYQSYQYNRESNKNRINREETMNEIFDNSIYDIWPKLNEQKLEVVIDGYKKLNNKINLIIHKLEDLINIKSKFYEQMADEDKLSSEKEREKICKVYNNIKKRIEKQNQIKSVQDKVLNELNFSREKKKVY